MGNIFRKCIRNSASATNSDVEYNETVSFKTHCDINDIKIANKNKKKCVEDNFELADGDCSNASSSHNGYGRISKIRSDMQEIDDLDHILDKGDIHGLRAMIDKLTLDHLKDKTKKLWTVATRRA